MISEHFETPEFIEVQTDDKTLYVSFDEAVSNPEVRVQVVLGALAEADAWNQRFGAFFERVDKSAALEIVNAIRQAKSTMLNQEEVEGAIEFDADEYSV